MDNENRVIVARTIKSKNVIQVLSLANGQIVSSIDSHDAKLKRTGGLAITNDCHVIVVDLGQECVRKYRYH